MKKTKDKTYNPIFSRAGGKARMLKYLLPLIPPHVCYVELFAGGAALLRAKPRSKVEVLNDIDGNIVNAFRACRFHADELVREMEGMLNSRRDFYDCLDQPGQTDIQRAARWLFANSVSFGGDNHSFAVGKDEGGGAVKSQVNLRNAIRELSTRLDKVAIEDLDWRKCIENYDAPETFFFCDPPYVGGSISQYGAWSQGAMADFAEALQRIKGKWLLTVNDSPSNRKLFSFARQKRITRPRGIANKTSRSARYVELIIWPNKH